MTPSTFEKVSDQGTATALTSAHRLMIITPGVSTEQLTPDDLVRFNNDEILERKAMAGEYVLTGITRHATYRYPTGGTVDWLDGSPSGVLQNVAPGAGALASKVLSYELTYPGRSRKVTVTHTRDAVYGDIITTTVVASAI